MSLMENLLTGKTAKLILISVIFGWIFWFAVIPYLMGTTILVNQPQIFEDMLDGALVGVLMWLAIVFGFGLFGRD